MLKAVDVRYIREELDVYINDYEVNNSFNHIFED